MADKRDFNILVVDNHPQTATSIATILHNEGFRAYEAYSIEKALEQYKQNKPDLIIIDIKLDSVHSFSELKILLMSFEDVPKNQLKKNVVGLLKKPISSDELIKLVKKALNIK